MDARQQAENRQKVEKLYSENREINAEIKSLQGNDSHKWRYIFVMGVAGIAAYILFMILFVSGLQGDGFQSVFGYFGDWTVLALVVILGMVYPAWKLRQYKKKIARQIAAFEEQKQENLRQIAALRDM